MVPVSLSRKLYNLTLVGDGCAELIFSPFICLSAFSLSAANPLFYTLHVKRVIVAISLELWDGAIKSVCLASCPRLGLEVLQFLPWIRLWSQISTLFGTYGDSDFEYGSRKKWIRNS